VIHALIVGSDTPKNSDASALLTRRLAGIFGAAWILIVRKFPVLYTAISQVLKRTSETPY
jgi:hypothetical protein